MTAYVTDADEDLHRLPLAVWDIILYGPASQREDDYIFIHIRIETYILQPSIHILEMCAI